MILMPYPSDAVMVNEWLSSALKHSDMKQAELARRLTSALRRSIDRAAVNKMLLGKRTIQADEFLEISRITRYPIPDLFGPKQVRLVGFVGAGSEMNFVEDITGVRGYAGQDEKTVAIEIQGGCLGESLDGWLAYYGEPSDSVTPDMIDQLCVVWTKDGRAFFKRITPGSVPGVYTLRSNFEPPVYDVAIAKAARIRHMQPKTP